MYLPAHFEETDTQTLAQLMREYPLGTWVLHAASGLLINHVPFMVETDSDGATRLVGHVARANPVWQAVAGADECVVVFQGPQTYISPSFYPSKQVDGKVVPTWNYAVVHAHGRAQAITDKTQLLGIVTRLTDTHEARRAAPWKVTDAPDDYIDKRLAGIVGIEIAVSKLVGKFKNSQNRPLEDRAGVAAGLGPDAPLIPPQS